MSMAVCPHCKDTGWVAVDDTTRRKCICAYAKELKEHLGKEIAYARTLEQSPLFVPGKDDLTEDDLFIKCDWPKLLPHLKWTLTFKTLAFKFVIVTDEKIKTVYLGAESYAARAKGLRDDVSTYNCLADLIGSQYDLVIIKLGNLGYPNKAMPGILKEALLLREALGKTTWLIEESDKVFGPGNFSYSPDLHTYIQENFTVVALEGEARHVPPLKAVTAPRKAEPIEDVSLDDPPEEAPVAATESAFKDLDWDIVAGGSPKRSKGGWKPKKRPSGGGPI
jgi:hypothetical protein